MPTFPLPEVPYHATAQRPAWADLPAELRDAIERQLGDQVSEATTAGAGFTQGFAAVLTTRTGHRAFIKAAPFDDPIAGYYAREAQITAVLPAGVPTARLRWTATLAGWFVICLEAVEGRVPDLPWRPADLAAALDAHATTAAALRTPPAELLALDLPTLADSVRQSLSCWQPIAAGHAPLPAMPRYGLGRLAELAALEAGLPDQLGVAGVLHFDLRLDNILIDPGGRAWICDWNWAALGPAWFDTLTLLVTAYASGLDADALFAAHPTTKGVPGATVDAALAALSGYCLVQGGRAPIDKVPFLRAHQRWTGQVTLGWLAERQGWPME